MKQRAFAYSFVAVLAVIILLLSTKESASIEPKGDFSKGLGTYLSYCWVCHGSNGNGNGPYSLSTKENPRDLTDQAYFSKKSDEDIYNIISKGGSAYNKSLHMKPMGFKLEVSDMWNLVAYIRFLSGGKIVGDFEIAHASAAEIYRKYCASCHGPEGRGDGVLVRYMPSPATTLGDRKIVSVKTDSQLYYSISGPKSIDLRVSDNYMPYWKDILSKEQINDLVQYIRNELAK